jgi:pyrroline-5-carboxylate reductase
MPKIALIGAGSMGEFALMGLNQAKLQRVENYIRRLSPTAWACTPRRSGGCRCPWRP